ncbi:hypothetical protein EDC01DRAFT_181643 [Geopyxis carbonaria]|nr:hypothetical protein EDC01DRAFT_181643 [Geopyxis carbonaria]
MLLLLLPGTPANPHSAVAPPKKKSSWQPCHHLLLHQPQPLYLHNHIYLPNLPPPSPPHIIPTYLPTYNSTTAQQKASTFIYKQQLQSSTSSTSTPQLPSCRHSTSYPPLHRSPLPTEAHAPPYPPPLPSTRSLSAPPFASFGVRKSRSLSSTGLPPACFLFSHLPLAYILNTFAICTLLSAQSCGCALPPTSIYSAFGCVVVVVWLCRCYLYIPIATYTLLPPPHFAFVAAHLAPAPLPPLHISSPTISDVTIAVVPPYTVAF